ncbi:DapH/DapD/GlmU-related protein [Streptomyces chryseus]|uniref:DapH/DapD/GlmU-related protein n=1 Tax=Streptomyces chryseus TaxID=68186 RepID=UPI00110F9319|nr:DapH/DapD/GlmU-related protein [Streptomyces chryseus]GGX39851.1 hypothetical protein GCM10010353_64060 [Streptomyces chryseus]
MTPLLLGDYLQPPTDADLTTTGYPDLSTMDLADFLTRWDDIHRNALDRLAHRIHPTAQIHPTALIGDDVIIGPGARVWEFSTVRAGSVLSAGVQIGFNSEVTRCFLGPDAVLGHRIGINRTLIGARAHLSANVTVAAISMWSPDMRTPSRNIILRGPQGLYRCGTPQFGAVIGDDCQTGNTISLGPGIALGRRCRIASGVTLAARIVAADTTITAPHTADMHLRENRNGHPGQ